MAATTMGVKLDDATRARLKAAALRLGRTPHWLIKQAIFRQLETLEAEPDADPTGETSPPQASPAAHSHRFLCFAESVLPQSVLRAAITAAYRRPEPELLPMLLEQARLPAAMAEAAGELAGRMAGELRSRAGRSGRTGLVQGLLQEFSLSSEEGVALMCLAEALLRIPDQATRDALIRDKISAGNWRRHLGHSPSVFVNAATWGLLLTGRLVTAHNEAGLSAALNRTIGKSGEPLVRRSVDLAMRLMGEQFVCGETIGEALANAGRLEARGFRYSYDMLGEAALTDADAQRYYAAYEQAIHAIGNAAHGRAIYEGPGISIKLSALHPRYCRAQRDRVMAELYPRLLSLTLLARHYDIGINIDAEEADRMELSLDLFEQLCFDSGLAGWNGIGFVIQAYQKRCPFAIDYLIELARRSRHRLMIRLVKGAYWDSEIKSAQLQGLEDYPVYTRKAYTDVAFIACARKLLAAPDAIFPQFATHNAQTLATLYHLAGPSYYPGQYEFQCLHGMGEPLYQQVVGKVAEGKLNRPCRIYAPVGDHSTLLSYLVRRLLENGANTSFVNRAADPAVALETLVRDPVAIVEAYAAEEGRLGLPHPLIPLPRHLYGSARINSVGIDLTNEHRLASLSSALLAEGHQTWQAVPILGCTYAGKVGAERGAGDASVEEARAAIANPADRRDIVGWVQAATGEDVDRAFGCALDAGPIWQVTPPVERSGVLERAADRIEGETARLTGLLVRESGKTFANAIAEVREAVDHLRYYAAQVRDEFSNDTHRPLGPLVCISPWNFPLAIFVGQIGAALAAGNTVLAKPAERTPLIAAEAVRMLLEAGVPAGVLQLLPGSGDRVGARLVADPRCRGVVFTGSMAVAKSLQRAVAGHLDTDGRGVPLIAETGGLNAMIADSSILPEQLVADVMTSAFDSAGQRCSSLRVLCLQQDIAERVIGLLRDAMAQYRMGIPDCLSTDVGPIIDDAARDRIEGYIQARRNSGFAVTRMALTEPDLCRHGSFVVPALIELDNLDQLEGEIFGPVLHVVRYPRRELGALIDRINGLGYGLTMGVHSRISETIDRVIDRARVGNLYVNRNITGAVVGVQPFGGEGLSGTGPKTGGPLYLYRMLAIRPTDAPAQRLTATLDAQQAKQRDVLLKPLFALQRWARQRDALTALCARLAAQSRSGIRYPLAGPTGETNLYVLVGRRRVLCLADREDDLLIQLAAVLAAGGSALWPDREPAVGLRSRLPREVQARIVLESDWNAEEAVFDAVLHHGDADQLRAVRIELARTGRPVMELRGMRHGETAIPPDALLVERVISINTAAAGGNPSLMNVG